MQHFICLHGHFYQPPRENPWLEAVELQDSAHPHHDWNERIAAECYAPNAAARILDAEGRIEQIVNNYARLSFNFGPTLLSWLERHDPDTYRAILAADRESRQRFSGHGSALAQVYNHPIMPLANRRDKATQVAWGLHDFASRFGRPPEGMWLAETAADLETLDILAEQGIAFTILSPHQARRVRPLRGGHWREVQGGRIDPTMPYLQRLPSGRTIALFFYDGPISQAVAFEHLLDDGERFARRLLTGFSDGRAHPQLVHIATDGETYGHHHRRGEMALAYALREIERSETVELTNYGEFLARFPPTHEVQIIERTAWSCSHGVGRWERDCGCNSGGHPGWAQTWRAPLREALDWLRDTAAPRYEDRARHLLHDPWAARDAYIDVIRDRSPANVAAFFARHGTHLLDDEERGVALKLLELQRQCLLMYTSCGWFFDELSGIETVQVIQYAGRALHLARGLFADDLEADFLDRLALAPSNLPEHRDGRQIYEKWVRPAMIELPQVGAHYAISAFLEHRTEHAGLDAFRVSEAEERRVTIGQIRGLVGHARIASAITGEAMRLGFGVLHFGDQDVGAGVVENGTATWHAELTAALAAVAERGDIAAAVRLLDRAFGGLPYNARSLFRDAQRAFLDQALEGTLVEDAALYRQIYERRAPLMRLLTSLGTPLPRPFQTAAEFIINSDLLRALNAAAIGREQVQALLAQAREWQVELERADLGYAFGRALERTARRLLQQAPAPGLLPQLIELVALAREMPFPVDFAAAQNYYHRLLGTAYAEMQDRADAGEDEARRWLDQVLTLGDQLGFKVTSMHAHSATPTLATIVRDLLERSRVPSSTYRLQLGPDFTFREALAIAPYLDELGVGDYYLSPIFPARAGSTHGYDVCDHRRINPLLGGEEGFAALAAGLRERGMGLLLDIVPNHMGIGDEANAWWTDVLENGPSSLYAAHFDIEWRPVKPDLRDKVLLPILGGQYGQVLEEGKLQLAYDAGAFTLRYYDQRLPIAPRTYRLILETQAEALAATLPPEHPHVQEYRSILTALSYLPLRTERDPDRLHERNREKEVIKRRLAALYGASEQVRGAIDAAVREMNGHVGVPRSFDRLDALLDAQAYRPAFWRVASEEINYRRFFDVNELAAIRVEVPEVFRATHELVFRLLAEGQITGLRIDHVDGLFDPAGYLWQLQEHHAIHQVRRRLEEDRGQAPDEPTLTTRVAAHLRAALATGSPDGRAAPGRWPLYVVVEKILGANEVLLPTWPVHGTTGYDFLTLANGLFVNRATEADLDALYRSFSGMTTPYPHLVNTTKKMTMLVLMASEIATLSHQLDRIAEQNRRYRDFTLDTLTFALREVIAALTVYRTYVVDAATVSPRDEVVITRAVADARRRNPRTAGAVFDFLRETLLLRNLADFAPEDHDRLLQWVRKFQQVTGPVMAKGVEDTAFYGYNRLISLNEVGGHPEHFGTGVDDFHEHNRRAAGATPHTLLATSTHDTKRSEDVRARLNVLSELPAAWGAALRRWADQNAEHGVRPDGERAPDRNDEYLLYQVLIGAWPHATAAGDRAGEGTTLLRPSDHGWSGFRERLLDYMQKATKEAKVHTSWINPNEAYDLAVRAFVERALDAESAAPFLDDARQFAERVAHFGRLNSLAQVLLKLTAPGVPDLYQGTELWDLHLVDPDNRRPVDYGHRRDLLAELRRRIAASGDTLVPLVRELLAAPADGRVKLYLTQRTLAYRREHPALFAHGCYRPLAAAGAGQEHVCAFLRAHEGQALVAVVPRLVVGLLDGETRLPLGAATWGETRLLLPDEQIGRRYRNVLTGEVLTVEDQAGTPTLRLDRLLASFPVALLDAL